VIMDLTIPGGMGGKEAIRHLLELDPQAVAIIASGYSRDPVMARFREYGFKDVIEKPFSNQRLSEALWRAVRGGRQTPVQPQ
jgi:two-component system cell cycle sensor histidine kinase/response regulator CckA